MADFHFFKTLLKLPASRLSRRIVFWVFASVILIEAIILVPSAHKRKGELLDLSLIHISEPTRLLRRSRMPSSA